MKTLVVYDTSEYCNETVENYIVEVLPPNKTTWVPFNVARDFKLILNSSNLRYKKAKISADLIDLPDGIYEFKQSVKPNITTLTQFYYLRIAALRLKYVEVLGCHFANECRKERKVYAEETLLLTRIRQYMDAAEYAVNDQHDKQKGINFYNQAIALINEFEVNCGCK